MARLLRALRHVLGAAVLLTGAVCLAEVWLSARRAEARADASAETLSELLTASRLCFHELRPLSGTTSSPAVRTNSYGLRGPEPAVPKPPGVFRVLVLGGEETLGEGLEESATWCAGAQTLLEGRTGVPVEIVNGGVPGGCPLTLSLLYRHRLTSLAADAVVLVMESGDVAEDVRRRPYLLTAEDGRPLACPHPALGGRAGRMEVWRDEFRLVDVAARHLMGGWVDHSPPVRDDLLCGARCREWLAEPGGAWAGPLQDALSPVRWLREDVEAGFATLAVLVRPEPGGAAAGWAEVARTLAVDGVRLSDPSAALSQLPGVFAEDGDLTDLGRQRMAYELAVLVAKLPGVAR